MKKEFYTAGELAKLTGVSYKTIRHYHKIGLLEPEKYTESGYRQYGMKSVETLQRILMLKYLNFSLDEIQKILLEEEISDTFSKQEKLLQAQEEHISQILKVVREIQKVNETERWEKMLKIIHMTQQKEEIIKQYKESGNLQKRINIHAYSTSKTDWFQWGFDGLQLKSGMKILELGCGNGMLWITMCHQLPRDIQIYLTDSSKNMLQSAKSRIEEYAELYKENNIEFVFLQRDAEDFDLEEKDFDRIIANHMLYHVSNENRNKLFKTFERLLKQEGLFYASTVGKTHLQELFPLAKEFDNKIDVPNWMTENFELENGEEQLKQVFSSVIVEEQENDLLVPNPQAVYDYIDSWPGNAKEILKGRENEWMEYLKDKISEETPYFIHKSTGAFKAFKKQI
ncbi:MerR family transcriptional regulator [Anaerosporobacter sp.]|uniref:MerR family transcriptional regulator n=1 Tax=Anaerosporobacter sp. TaxID=1872529 RepID=UPI00286F5EF8|nr:MerR family transcriptional regulator [Anaerosporobacter sp.]